MGLVDTLDHLPADHPGRDTLANLLLRIANVMVRYQAADGRWWQVVDQGAREGNYLESSVTAMMAYALAKGVNDGHLPSRFGGAAQKAYEGLLQGAVTVDSNGLASLDRICQVAGLGGGRDGSYAYYLREPIVSNDPKGLGPFILAGLELAKLLRQP